VLFSQAAFMTGFFSRYFSTLLMGKRIMTYLSSLFRGGER